MTPSPSYTEATKSSPSVLIIEDDPAFSENLATLLEAEAYSVFTAHSGESGLAYAASSRPDVILCDVGLPAIDGYDVLKRLRQMPETSKTPVLMITARADQKSLRAGMSLGADDYICKPFTAEELLGAIRQRLRRIDQFTQSYRLALSAIRNSALLTLPDRVRNPLSVILLGADLLSAELNSPAQRPEKEVCSQIIRSGETIGRILDRFTELIVIAEQGTTWPQDRSPSATLDIDIAVRRIAEKAAALHHRQQDLRLRLRAGNARIDDNHTEIAIKEIVDNAFRYTSPGTRIVIASRVIPSGVRILVGDRGAGVGRRTMENSLAVPDSLDFLTHDQPGLGLRLAQLVCFANGGQCWLKKNRRSGSLASLEFRASSPRV